jgi:hypothetical protein
MSDPASFILHADGLPAPRESPAMGDDRPAEILGQKVKYLWKPILRAEEYRHPQRGWTLSVTPERLESLARNHKRLIANGVKPFIPDRHRAFDAKSNFGWLLEMKVEGDTLWGLHQLIGEDAHKAAARNDTSVCIHENFKDGRGNVYPEVVTHNAMCPDPVAPGLGGFVALSVSSDGSPESVAPVYVPAAGQRSPDMKPEQLERIRKLPGAKDVTEDNALDFLITAATPKPDAVTMSRADKEKLDGDLAALRTEKTNLEGRVTELSSSAGDKAPKPPDPEILRDRHENAEDKINLAVARGEMPRAFADKIIGRLGTREQPSVFMLSRQDALGDRPADFILSLFKGEKFGVKVGEETGQQSGTLEFARTPPQPAGGKKTDEQIGQEAEAEGAKWRDEQLRARGIVTTAAK